MKNGDAFPAIAVSAVDGGTLSLPGYLSGSYGVVLAYRGAWCPLCVAQLREFVEEKAALDALGVQVVALPVDSLASTIQRADTLKPGFALGHSADAARIAELTGAFTNAEPAYLQPTAFIVSPLGTVMACVCASQAVGRRKASDVLKFVGFMKSQLGS